MERKITLVSGRSLRIRRVASKLLIPAIPISMRTTSGRTCCAKATASMRVGGLADHFQVGFGGEQGPDALPEQRVIVG